MKLHERSEAKLRMWLRTDTWHRGHPLDMGRFYDFVAQLWRDHGEIADEGALQESIEREVGATLADELRDVIRERITLASNILDFLQRHPLADTQEPAVRDVQ